MSKQPPTRGAKLLGEIMRDMTPAEVAVALDCSVTTLYNMRNGDKPSLHVANNAKRKFKIPTEAWESPA